MLVIAGILGIVAGIGGLAAIAFNQEIFEQLARFGVDPKFEEMVRQGRLKLVEDSSLLSPDASRLVALALLCSAPTLALIGGVLAFVPRPTSGFAKAILGGHLPARTAALWMLTSAFAWWAISLFVRSGMIIPLSLLSAVGAAFALFVWLNEWRGRKSFP